jgi:SAM-dependent methyltransferase
MKPLPKETLSYRPLYEITQGALYNKILQAGLSLKVFDQLGEYRTAEEAAQAISAHPDNTRHFLNALATIGLLEKKQGRFRNLPVTDRFLNSSSECYLGPLFRIIQEMSIDSLEDLESLVLQGPCPPDPDEDFSSPELWADGARASAGWALGEMGRIVANIASGLPGFDRFEKMLDLGGGHGIFALYMVEAHPSMKGVVFDRQPVVTVAEEFAQTYGLSDRVSVMAGDYLQDDIGGGYDLIWACSTLNFARGNLDGLITKIHAALKPGGYFVSLQDGLVQERTQPDIMLGALGMILRMGMDYQFDQGEVGDSILRCGFRSLRSRTLDTPMGVMDLDVAWK